MSADIVIIPVCRDVEARLATDEALRAQYRRECDALDQAMREPAAADAADPAAATADRRARAMTAWTEGELKTLQLHYPSSTPDELRAALPRHSYASIRAKAHELGLRKIEHFRSTRRLRSIAIRHVPAFDFGSIVRRAPLIAVRDDVKAPAPSPVIATPPSLDELIDEAALIIYGRWRRLGLSHVTSLGWAAFFARRAGAGVARPGPSAETTVAPMQLQAAE